MATHDYKCNEKNCDYIIEICTNFEKVPKVCPQCKKGKLKKIFSGIREVGLEFIGDGFYINDYGKHRWKDGKSQKQIEDVLIDNKDPY